MFSFVAPLAGDQLQTWIDPILKSKPYKKDGLVVVMFDNAPQALVLSPFVEAGSTNDRAYDSYSLVKTIEDRIGLGEHLGGADDKKVRAFGNDVFDTELDPYQDPSATVAMDEREAQMSATTIIDRLEGRPRHAAAGGRGAAGKPRAGGAAQGAGGAARHAPVGPRRPHLRDGDSRPLPARRARQDRREAPEGGRRAGRGRAPAASRGRRRGGGVYLVRGASRAWGNLLLAVRYSPHGERRGGDDRRFHHPVTWPSHGSPIAHR